MIGVLRLAAACVCVAGCVLAWASFAAGGEGPAAGGEKPVAGGATKGGAGGPVVKVEGERFVVDGAVRQLWGIRVAGAAQSEALTEQLIAQLDEYKRYGINAITVFVCGSRNANSDPFSPDGTRIDPAHLARLKRITEAAGDRGMVVILGVFYQHAPFGLKDAAAVETALRLVTREFKPYRNVILNPANEQNCDGWTNKRHVFPFQDVAAIVSLCDSVHAEDPARIVGAGGYDDDKNDQIGRSKSVDVLLFDFNVDARNLDRYRRFRAAGVVDKPIVNVEMFGVWTKSFDKGVFPESLKAAHAREIDDTLRTPGLSVFFHNSPWIQGTPNRFDLAGPGTPDSPGIRWYFELLAEKLGH